VDLIMTSPPYPLLKPREYGNTDHKRWVEWMLRECENWIPLLTSRGSMMLNVGNAWNAGVPSESSYIERLVIGLEDKLGMHLIQRLYWHNPAKLPAPMPWVAVQRLRVKQTVEPILWMEPTPHAKGNNRHVLTPYTKGGLKALKTDPRRARPCGYKFGENSFVDNGGAIPSSVITCATGDASDKRYQREERKAGRQAHPAIMPAAVARFGILLATDELDTVYDPMAGSGTVAVEAEKLNRFAIASERSREYLESARIRCLAEGLQIREAA
jgi:site-specific DNA-methyltransferase (cytosine-N4-specific)